MFVNTDFIKAFYRLSQIKKNDADGKEMSISYLLLFLEYKRRIRIWDELVPHTAEILPSLDFANRIESTWQLDEDFFSQFIKSFHKTILVYHLNFELHKNEIFEKYSIKYSPFEPLVMLAELGFNTRKDGLYTLIGRYEIQLDWEENYPNSVIIEPTYEALEKIDNDFERGNQEQFFQEIKEKYKVSVFVV